MRSDENLLILPRLSGFLGHRFLLGPKTFCAVSCFRFDSGKQLVAAIPHVRFLVVLATHDEVLMAILAGCGGIIVTVFGRSGGLF